MIMSNEPTSTSSSALKDHASPSYEPSTSGPASHSNSESHNHSCSSEPLSTQLPTPDPDPITAPFPSQPPPSNDSESSSSATDWTQRCTTYYAKRRLQEPAIKPR